MIKHAIIIAVAAQLGGCATVARGPNADMVVDTEPPGATVTTDLPAKGKLAAGRGCAPTPCSFEVPRRAKFLMTIAHEDREPMEIGVISTRHKESLDANMAGAGGVGAAAGLAGGAIAGAWASAYGGSVAGTALAGGAVVGGVVTLGVGAVSLGVDGATGALMNPNPNPVFLALPEKGAVVGEHPSVQRLRIFRTPGPEGRAARKAYKTAIKAERKRLKALEKAERKRRKAEAREAQTDEPQMTEPLITESGS